MENINNIRNEAPPVIYNQDDITRCVECNLICLLKLNYKEGKPFINYECENGYKGNILLKDYINQYNKFSISKEKYSYEESKEGNKYISFLQNLQNIYSNSMKNIFKSLTNHKILINLSTLTDGRLISCSYDKSLNIYKKILRFRIKCC